MTGALSFWLLLDRDINCHRAQVFTHDWTVFRICFQSTLHIILAPLRDAGDFHAGQIRKEHERAVVFLPGDNEKEVDRLPRLDTACPLVECGRENSRGLGKMIDVLGKPRGGEINVPNRIPAARKLDDGLQVIVLPIVRGVEVKGGNDKGR
jgi:hypothetical protein